MRLLRLLRLLLVLVVVVVARLQLYRLSMSADVVSVSVVRCTESNEPTHAAPPPPPPH